MRSDANVIAEAEGLTGDPGLSPVALHRWITSRTLAMTTAIRLNCITLRRPPA
jgi:hypothetical protein